MSIPRRIIQTARSRDLLPLARAGEANLRLLHPDWEHLFFDDSAVDRFVRDEFPQHQAVFEAFPYRIQRFDFFRYLAVYRHGGFYFDLDVFLWEGLTGLLQHAAVFPFEELTLSQHLRRDLGMDWEIGNYAFGAEAGHPFLEAVIENCIRGQTNCAWLEPMMQDIPSIFRRDFEVLNSTGPGLLSRTLAGNPDAAASVTVLFPPDVCKRESWHRFGSVGVHLMEGSWRDRGSFVRRRLAWWWEARRRKRLLPESLALGPTRELAVRSPAAWASPGPAHPGCELRA